VLRRIIRWSLIAMGVLMALAAVVLLTLRPPAPLIAERRDLTLPGVTVVNPGLGRRRAQRLAIHGSIIASISDDAGAPDPGFTARYAGAYVLPGLIDMHVHHPPARAAADTQMFGLLYLAHGVTSVRDTGNFDGSILKTRERIRAGEVAGPRLFACGPIIDGDPPVWPGSKVVHTAEEGQRAVDEIAATGVDCIKAYENLSADALRGVRAGAARHHLPLVGHVPSAVPFEAAHLDDVQHLTGIPLSTPVAGADPSQLILALLRSWTSLDDARAAFAVHVSIEQKLVHTPTIAVIDRLTRLNEYSMLLLDPDAQLLPRYYREIFWQPAGFSNILQYGWPDGEAVRANFRTVVRQLHEAGVTIHVGTDVLNPFVVPGASMDDELRNFTQCGFTPEQAWAAATRQNGAFLPLPRLGVIEPGAPADLLIFRRDPTQDLAALSTLGAVVADGRFYATEMLANAIARHHDKFAGWLYDHITMRMVRALARPMTDRRPPADTRP
jgi:cytosine/adenosine deaminase-related metal-dependent hydrolase